MIIYLQAGGELTDFIIVLRTDDAVKTFTGNVHLSFGAGLSAAVGNVGRAVEADVRAGDGGCAACYTYSCSKGICFSFVKYVLLHFLILNSSIHVNIFQFFHLHNYHYVCLMFPIPFLSATQMVSLFSVSYICNLIEKFAGFAI